jgi:hypothetical protein
VANSVANSSSRGHPPLSLLRQHVAQPLGGHVGLAVARSRDAAYAAIRARLATALPVQNPNPLGAALSLLLGAGAAASTTSQQAVVAAVFELCLAGVMVIYELLGHAKQQAEQVIETRTRIRRYYYRQGPGRASAAQSPDIFNLGVARPA